MEAHADKEQEIEGYCSEERYDDATVSLLKMYGAEITGLLVALARDEAQAADAYSLFCERVWRSLPRFRFESSVRTWAYVIARRSLHDARNNRGPKLVNASPSELPEMVAEVRSTTQAYLRTTYKRELRQLRDLLSPDDQLLLVLRIDKDMIWEEIARVLSDDERPSVEQLRRDSVALRKRFSRAKARLSTALRARRGSQER